MYIYRLQIQESKFKPDLSNPLPPLIQEPQQQQPISSLQTIRYSTSTPKTRAQNAVKRVYNNTQSSLPPPSNHPTQPARNSTSLRCCLDHTRTRRRIDSIRLEVVRLSLCSRGVASRATESARPPPALCDEVVVQFQQLLGLQADALECAFQSETAGGIAAGH
jgi:hypothetical protein